MKKKRIYGLGLIILIISLGMFYFSYFNNGSKGAYLKRNYKTTNFTEKEMKSAYKIINDGKDYNVFFTGEHHGYDGNEKISLELLKYLNENYGVNYLLFELQYSFGKTLNEYLHSGDETLLNDVSSILKSRNPQNFREDFVNFWKELYEYNRTLPENKKIQAVGIDMDFEGKYTVKQMGKLLPDKNPPEEIKEYILKFKELFEVEMSDEEGVEVFQRLYQSVNESTKIYEEYLGETFRDFKNNLASMMNTLKYSETEDPNRDGLIYDNFMKIYNENPQGKYYGQFGLYHIFKEDFDKGAKPFYTLANMIEEKGKLKVLSAPIVYSNNFLINEDVKSLCKNKFTVVKLNGRNSPYKKELINDFESDAFKLIKGSTTDNYQYMILLSYE